MINSIFSLTIFSFFKNFFKSINISTLFTILRIILVPFIVNFIVTHDWYLALVLFLIAAFSDVIDGALARYLKEETVLGSYLDPLADKFLLLACFVAFAFVESPYFKIPGWFIVILLTKEILLVFGALYLLLFKNLTKIRPSILGKLSTFGQVLFINYIFLISWLNISQNYLDVFIYLTLFFSVITFFHYAIIFLINGFKS